MSNSEDIPEPTVSFGSKRATKGTMGHAEESPGHSEKIITKGAASKDKDNQAGGLAILPPFSKAKIKSISFKEKGDV
ncbi:MAG TPA: hypothetical protein VIA08_03595 [Nitrososphaeraceae archaeon]